MSSTNVKRPDTRFSNERLAGGYGALAATQDSLALLRRAVLANLLWENIAYEDGESVVANITRLVPLCKPEDVAALAIEARTQQKLRHVPLFLALQMAEHKTHLPLVGSLLPKICLRPDDLTEFVALYWKEKKRPLAKQIKIGLATAFKRFDAYQLGKYKADGKTVSLRDVMFLVHPTPANDAQAGVWKQFANQTLPAPDTWEVALSTGKDKKATWERLILENKLGGLAFLRNLKNMQAAGVSRTTLTHGFGTVKTGWLLPLDFLKAVKMAPEYVREIETMMLNTLRNMPKLTGRTIMVVDVSGSMASKISEKSDFTRMDAALAMAMLAAEVCESVAIYATAGSDRDRQHNTAKVSAYHGFGLIESIMGVGKQLGGGGIFTRQCLEYIKEQEKETPDRVIIFSDSQDCDFPDKRTPRPIGERNYICDVSANAHGVAYKSVWSAEISGFSEHFLSFIMALEGLRVEVGADDELQTQ